MKKKIAYLFCFVFLATCSKETQVVSPCQSITLPTDARPVVKTNHQKLFVAYQAWFDNPSTSGNGKWGQHWTMTNQNPDLILPDGRRQIASYFYPMIGPYASSDPDVINYHLLLMKYAGIDGVIVDWYGSSNVYDYPLTRRNTDSLFHHVPKVGLQFAVCYEDATLPHVKAIAGTDYVQAALQDFDFLQYNYFGFSHYITIDHQPLVLCFGPQALKTVGEWQQSFSKLCVQPKFISLEYHGDAAGTVNNGEFAWVGPGNLADLQNFYQNRAPQFATSFAAAYPGFKDFYAPGGWGNTLLVIDHNGTNTLQNTLDLAQNSGLSYLQLITWNDFGEGTMLEPTLEFGFTYLETIQKYTGVAYTKVELQLIYQWYTLRKKYKGNISIEQKLNESYMALVSLDVVTATTIISSIP